MKQQGHSLIELLFVIALIGLTASLVIPKPAAFDQIMLEGEAMQLASDLRWLQRYSMNIARGHVDFPRVTGDLVPKMRFILGENGRYTISLGTNSLRIHHFARGVGVAANYGSIFFNSQGYINQPVTIVLYQQERHKAVVVDRVGRIRIE